MLETFGEKVLKIVENWIPKKKYSKETEYRDDLAEFIRKELYLAQKQNPLSSLLGPQEHRVKTEAGRGYADIEIDEKIGIELKRNLNGKPQINRLYGQITEYNRQYDRTIVVLCGKMKEQTVEELKFQLNHIDQIWGNFWEDIRIVRKDEA
jgi:hypothetical protein